MLDNSSNCEAVAEVSASSTITFGKAAVVGTSVVVGVALFTATAQKGPNVTYFSYQLT